MILWGGLVTASTKTATGARYNPVTDSWLATSSSPLLARSGFTAVWTGTSVAVWGGRTNVSPFYANTGGLYNPTADSWTFMTTVGAPVARSAHSAVWTGKRMIVWGGDDGVGNQSTGGRYDPILDTWSPTAMLGVPGPRSGHNAVWTGSQMLVWGGQQYSGGRYSFDESADDDSDGVTVCGGDCDDGDASTWRTPGEVLNLDLLATPGSGDAALTWSQPSSTGGLAVAYDTIRAAGSLDFTGAGATCIESDDGSDTAAVDADTPPAGNVFYYLVRAQNGCPAGLGQGPLGAASDGSIRTGRACP
jgi:hypothetical protein